MSDEALENYRRNMNALGIPPVGDATVYLDPADRMNLDINDEVLVCATCGQTLNLLTFNEAETWVHSRSWDNYDHEPVPRAVPRSTIDLQTCDFCGEIARLHWAFVGDRLRQGSYGSINDFGTTWRACQPCSELIHESNIDRLLDRVMRVSVLRDPARRASSEQVGRALLEMWTKFFATVHTQTYVGPRREPAKLNARMMPKLQMGLLKFWASDSLHEMVTGRLHSDMTQSLPGVHCGDEEQFSVQFSAENKVPAAAWTNHAQHLSAGIAASDLYWISPDFTQLAIMAGKDFEKLIISREELPTPFGFMMYEQPIGEIPRPGGNAAIRGVSWTLVPGGIWLNLYIQGEDSAPEVDVERMRTELGYLLCPNPGSGFPFDVEIPLPEPGEYDFISIIFATWFLMTQPGVADQAPAPVDRKYARSFQRQHNRALPAVQLVNLRKQPHRSGAEPETREGRKLSVRVYRKGHWKRQAYGPKWGMRKTIYVNAYIAGPEGAPLKDRPTVVKVLR